MTKYNWKLIRICYKCGREYEQDIDNYVQWTAFGGKLVIPDLILKQPWPCSDCQLIDTKRRRVKKEKKNVQV